MATTPLPLSDVDSLASGTGSPGILGNNSSICSPSPISSTLQHQHQQQQQQKQQQQSNVSSVLYAVQRVVTTTQIQTTGTFVGSNMSNIGSRGNDMHDGGTAQISPGLSSSHQSHDLNTAF